MSAVRRFLLSSSFARLIMRQRSFSRIVQGHFPISHERLSFVHFEDGTCQLVLVTKPDTEWEEEERTEVPAKQGEFLLQVSAGSLAFDRCSITLGESVVSLDSFQIPHGLHIVQVEFEGPEAENQFVAPSWLGAEVTGDPHFEPNAIATSGLPALPVLPVTDSSLHAVLDLLDSIESEPGAVKVGTATVAAEREAKDLSEEQTTAAPEEEAGTGSARSFPHRPHRNILTAISQRRALHSASE
jgi:CYTH domain-containing protein